MYSLRVSLTLPLALWATASLAGLQAPPRSPPPVAGPSATTGAAPPTVPRVLLLELEGNPGGRELAAGVGSLLASDLGESPRLELITLRDVASLLGPEGQRLYRELQGCGGACAAELSGALGARYAISGRLDRFGNTFALATTLVDTVTATILVRAHSNAASDADLPAAIFQVTRDLLAKLPRPPGAPPDAASPDEASGERGVVLSLKGGSSFISSLESLSPAGDVEVGYRFHPEWVAFLQIGVAFIKAQDAGGTSGINIVPSVVGARHLYGGSALQPYWGLGLGIQLAFGEFGIFTRTGVLPSLVGLLGLQYLFTHAFGVVVEAKTNLARAVLGLTSGGLGSGLNLDLSLGLVYRF